MAKIEKLPSGRYRTRVFNKYTGKQKSITAASIREVKALAAQYSFSVSIDEEDCTIKEAVTRYIENRSSVLSPSTQTVYKKILKNNLSGIEDYIVSEITSEQIQRFVNDLSVGHAPKTVRNVYGLVISSIHAILPDKHIHVALPQKKPIERHIPTDKDIKALLDNTSGNLRKAILLASVGTLRRGEISALKYSDIQGNTIHVHADMVRTPDKEWVYKDVPKTSSSDRYIDFPREVIRELVSKGGNGYVVNIVPSTITRLFEKHRKKLGLQCRFHDLRHYAASIMHSLGVPDSYIMERGGWSTDVTLKSVYRHSLSDQSKQFSKKTNDYMKKIL